MSVKRRRKDVYFERIVFLEAVERFVAFQVFESENIVRRNAFEDLVVDGRVPVRCGAEHGIELVANTIGHVDLLGIIEIDSKMQSE